MSKTYLLATKLLLVLCAAYSTSVFSGPPANDCSDGQTCCYSGPAGNGWWTPSTLNRNVNRVAECSGTYQCCTAAANGSGFSCLPGTQFSMTRKLATIASGNWMPVAGAGTCGPSTKLSCPLDLNRCNDNSGAVQTATCTISDTDINTFSGTVHAELAYSAGVNISAEIPCVGGASANASVTASVGGSYTISGTSVVSINYSPSESVNSCDAIQGTKEWVKNSGSTRYTMDGFQVCRFVEAVAPGNPAPPRTFGQTGPIAAVMGVGTLNVTAKQYFPAGEGPASPGCFRRGCGPRADCSTRAAGVQGPNCSYVIVPDPPPTGGGNPPAVTPGTNPMISTSPLIMPSGAPVIPAVNPGGGFPGAN